MTPWTNLITPARIPPWRGVFRIHSPLGVSGKQGSYAQRWEPWTLISPGVMLPRRSVVAQIWALL